MGIRKAMDPKEAAEKQARARAMAEGEALYTPTPEALLADAAAIRATWSPATALARLRPDWRPVRAELTHTSVEHGETDERRWHDRAFSRNGGADQL